MKKNIILTSIMSILLIISACENNEKAQENTKGETVKEETTKSIVFNEEYNSVNDYNEKIIGEHLKTGLLQIELTDNYLDLEIDFFLSDELDKLMKNTKNKFYFTIADVDGKDNLKNGLKKDPPSPVVGNMNVLQKKENTYSFSQKAILKSNLTESEKAELLKKENYQFEVLNEEKEIVAVIIGLEVNMIPE